MQSLISIIFQETLHFQQHHHLFPILYQTSNHVAKNILYSEQFPFFFFTVIFVSLPILRR
jgi:hypothetical protein